EGALSGGAPGGAGLSLVRLRPLSEAAVLRWLAQGHRHRARPVRRRNLRDREPLRLQGDRRSALLRRVASFALTALLQPQTRSRCSLPGSPLSMLLRSRLAGFWAQGPG